MVDFNNEGKQSNDEIYRRTIHELSKQISERNRISSLIESENRKLLQRVSDLNNVIQSLEAEAVELGAGIEHTRKIASDLENQNAFLSGQLQEATAKAQAAERVVADQRNQITSLTGQLQEATNYIHKLDDDIAEIRGSIVWNVTMKFNNGFVEKVFPRGSITRDWYDLGLKGGRTLMNEGFRSLLLKYKCYKKSLVPPVDDYKLWIQKNEPDKKKLEQMKKKTAHFEYKPLISIIMPVWNTDERWLKAAIESVLAQIYNNWELCIVDGGSTKGGVHKILNNFSKKNKKIKVKYLDENMGIAGNSNEAISLASGEYLCFLDHDDELANFSLFEVVSLLNKNRGLDFIYSDEDKLDESGRRCDVFFKPDWSPDLFLSCMYTCHLGVYRKEIVDIIGGIRNNVEGSQDYDFVLRFVEQTNPNKIAHITRVLYHWRKNPGSLAGDPFAKNCVNIQSAKRALNDALLRRGIRGEVCEGKWISSYRIKRDIIGNPLVTIIIPTKDQYEKLVSCVNSIRSITNYNNYELVIVNNDSTDPMTVEYLSMLDCIVLNYAEQFNFSKIINFASRYAKGEYLLFLNNDTQIITPEWIEALLEHAQRPEVGAVGCKLIYPDKTIQHAGVVLGLGAVAGHIFIKRPYNDPGYFGLIDVIRNYSAITAACMMIRKDVFDNVKGFDENLQIAYNDVDLCLRLRQEGFLIVYTPYAEIMHYESTSRGVNIDIKGIQYMENKWGISLKNDPYYNPNLSLSKTNCEVNL
jgi:GT2 family glycosyltransferase